MKIVINRGGEPFGIAFWQALVCAAFLYTYILFKHGKIGINKAHMKLIFFLGIFGSALPNVLFYWSAERLNAGILAISVSFIPLLTYTLALLLHVENFSLKRVTGVILGAIALNILIIPENSMPHRTDIVWLLIACIAAVSYAVENLLIDLKMPSDIGPVRIACGMNLMGALLVSPLYFASQQTMPLQFPPTALELSIAGLGLINAIAYSTFIFLIQRTGSVFASQTGYVVTVGGMLWGIMLFSEIYSLWVWTSIFILILAVILVSPRDSR